MLSSISGGVITNATDTYDSSGKPAVITNECSEELKLGKNDSEETSQRARS
jgi:hypothetical protein